MKRIGTTDLTVHPLCLGGNVFGWGADEAESFRVLDAYADAGGNFVDTADVYSAWVDGNEGGESEAIIGRWMAARGNRDRMVIATKVGMKTGLDNLRPDTIRAAADASLERLGVDHIDLYYAHTDDAETPIAETLGAFGQLVDAGKVRHIAASNFSGGRLRESAAVAEAEGLPRYVAYQPHYNLLEREVEEAVLPASADLGLATFPYFSLASGFLTGKHRDGEAAESMRGSRVEKYADARGDRVLSAMDTIADARSVGLATIALAWLAQRPTVVSPIASARTVDQLPDLLALADLELTAEEMALLEEV
ncbi:putative oxidoreductase [Euzebya pacifica]|uniref:Putative oxidoreductase n=1 Tax=Euzebya pacifica TaxID=1608957 RepID=A0A346XXN6_9ACTN|nr:aldo/keto reductase [Euzebya pacifica]AXV06983.1 putative oxidoreductase [Euzebya pacifica]